MGSTTMQVVSARSRIYDNVLELIDPGHPLDLHWISDSLRRNYGIVIPGRQKACDGAGELKHLLHTGPATSRACQPLRRTRTS